MNEFAILAFVIAPMMAVALGFLALKFGEREVRRFDERVAAEKVAEK